MLNVSEVYELSGIPEQTLRNWIASGLIEPDTVGEVGRSNTHEFGISKTVGLCIANELRQAERGCVLSFTGQVVEAFGNVDEKWLLATIKDRGRHFACGLTSQGKPIIQEADPRWGWPNVEKALKKVKDHADKKANK